MPAGRPNPLQVYSDVRNTIRRYSMLKKGDRVLVCVSGGPDSVFLLHALKYLSDEFGVTLAVAHLDHGIRGGESSRDAVFVKALARRLNVPATAKKISIGKTKKLSLEEAARERRYAFFKDAAARHRANKIATAHNLDDQAETVLMRVIKGAGIRGLSGIPPVRQDGRFTFIRPVIEIEKKAITAFLRLKGLRFRLDKTNRDDKFFRNAVRNKVLPYLTRYNTRVKYALANMSDNARDAAESIEYIRMSADRRLSVLRGYGVKASDLAGCPASVRREIVREMLSRGGCNIKKLTHGHWKEINSLVSKMPSGKSIDLPGGRRIVKEAGFLRVFPGAGRGR